MMPKLLTTTATTMSGISRKPVPEASARLEISGSSARVIVVGSMVARVSGAIMALGVVVRSGVVGRIPATAVKASAAARNAESTTSFSDMV